MFKSLLLSSCIALTALSGFSAKADWISTDEMLINPTYSNGLSGWQTSPGVYLFGQNLYGSGNNYGMTASDTSTYFVRQTVNLDTLNFNLALIDSGEVRYNASTWQIGWNNDSDRGRFLIRFLNGSGQIIQDVTQGYKDPTSLTKTTLTNFIPIGTRSILFSLDAVRSAGTVNSNHFGNNSLKLSAQEETALLYGNYFIQGIPAVELTPTPSDVNTPINFAYFFPLLLALGYRRFS